MNEVTSPEMNIQRIYLKDASFESPRSPQVFRQGWKPRVNLEINSKYTPLEEDLYEVVLVITASVKSENEETLYLVEVHQAGIFLIRGFSDPDRLKTLGSYCPSHLFPYARETIDSLVVKGSFPPLSLAPVNFEAIYADSVKNRSETQH